MTHKAKSNKCYRARLITFESGMDGRCREQATPTVAKFHVGNGVYKFCVIGTSYGFIHTHSGAVRLWGSYSGARRVAREYNAHWEF